MAKLGSPQTNKFAIGTAEVRVGPLTLANKLTQSHSVGLVDEATLEVSQESVDLEGGFPQVIVDTAIVRQSASLTATLREYSRRNMQVLTGGAASTTLETDVRSLVVTNAASGATSFDVTASEGANFTAGDLVVIYPEGDPAAVSICLVDGITTDTLTLNANTPTLHDYDGTTLTINVFVAKPVSIGGVSSTNYMAVQFIQTDREHGQPVVGNFWKAAVGAGMTLGTNATDFSSTELNLKLLQPAAAEYGTGGDLEHLAAIIPSHPTGFLAAGGDA